MRFVEHWPERCQACARVFAAWESVDAAKPWRQQVAELPPIAVRVSEHRLHAVCCPRRVRKFRRVGAQLDLSARRQIPPRAEIIALRGG
jgi:hypothetical protein